MRRTANPRAVSQAQQPIEPADSTRLPRALHALSLVFSRAGLLMRAICRLPVALELRRLAWVHGQLLGCFANGARGWMHEG